MPLQVVFFAFVFFTLSASAQLTPQGLGGPKTKVIGRGELKVDSAIILPRKSLYKPSEAGALRYDSMRKKPQYFDSTAWVDFATATDTTIDLSNPFTTSIPELTGATLGPSSQNAAIRAILYPKRPPTAGLTLTYSGSTSGSFTLERMASGSALTGTLNWTAGRGANTPLLTSVVVNSVSEAFLQPAPGASTSGTEGVTITRNVTNTYNNIVTASDGKATTATVTVSFAWKRYAGFTNSGNPNDATIQSLFSEWAETRTRDLTGFFVPTGAQAFCIAFPESLDPSGVSQIMVGGIDFTSAFNRVVRPFTNASGATTNYIIYTANYFTNGQLAYEIK